MNPLSQRAVFLSFFGWTRNLLLLIGIDGPVFYTLLWRIWMAVSGLVAIILLPLLLSPIQQGYYFTFDSLINLKILFDLGFSIVITQFASHEIAGLQWIEGRVEGDEVAKSRLASLVRLALTWYFYAAVFIAVILIPGGIWFFGTGHSPHPTFAWIAPWLCLVTITACNLMLSPLFALLEGCGAVREVAQMRVVEVLVTSLTLWISLSARTGLFAMAFASTAGLMWQFYWLYSRYRAFLMDLRHTSKTGIHVFNWIKDILPLQWRIAVSWISGYCVYSSITPIVFRTNGPELAGRVGMSLLIAQGILTLSIAVVKTKVPRFGMLIAQARFRELDDLYRRVARQSLAFSTVGSVLLLSAALIMAYTGVTFRKRLLDPLSLSMILAATVINSMFQSQAMYLRAHKMEPFLVLAVVDAAVSLPLYYVSARYAGAPGIAFSFFAITVLAGCIWANFIFRRFRAARAG